MKIEINSIVSIESKKNRGIEIIQKNEYGNGFTLVLTSKESKDKFIKAIELVADGFDFNIVNSI